MGDIADVVGGGTPRTNNPENFEGGAIPWITPADLSGYTAKYISHGERFITERGLKSSSARMVPSGTVLFTSRAPVGYVAIASNEVSTNQGFKSFVLKTKDILPDYVYWWLKGNKDLAESFASGTTFLELSGSKAKQIPIPIAPYDQQKYIVAEIEKQFSRLDEAVANLKRVKANLKRYKAAVLKAAVEGKLTEQWRKEHPDVEPASKLLERIIAEKSYVKKYQLTMKDKKKESPNNEWKEQFDGTEPPDVSTFSPLPENWCWAQVGDIGHVQLGRQRAPKYHSGHNMRPYLRVQNVFEDRIDLEDVMEMDFSPRDFEKFKLEPGDILLNEGQSPELLGRPAIYRGELPGACFTNTLIRFRPHILLGSEYPMLVFRSYMRSGRFTRIGTITTNIAHLSAGRFAKVEFPVPPAEEIKKIVNEAARQLSAIDVFEKETEQALTRSNRLRQSVLKKVFSGGLIHVTS